MKINDTEISEEGKRESPLDELKGAAQRKLAAGVLKQAAQDLRRFHGATSKIERELYFDAYRWLTLDECSSPFSFVNICQLLDLAPDNVRQELIGELASGTFSYWIRRCWRAAHRLRSSFKRLFVSEPLTTARMLLVPSHEKVN